MQLYDHNRITHKYAYTGTHIHVHIVHMNYTKKNLLTKVHGLGFSLLLLTQMK